MGTTEPIEILNVELPPEDIFQQLLDYFGTTKGVSIKHKVPFSHLGGRWSHGPFKINIAPSNSGSQVLVDFSCLHSNLMALLLIVIGFIILSMGLPHPYIFLFSGVISFIYPQWQKKNAVKKLQKLFKIGM